MIISIQIASLEGAAKNRPEGYLEDCKNHAESWQGRTASYTKENWDLLCEKYKSPCPDCNKKSRKTKADRLTQRCTNCRIDGKAGCAMHYRAKAAPCRVKPIIESFPCHIIQSVKERWELCKKCPHTKHGGDGCTIRNKCCFGSWRAKPASFCPDEPSRWGRIEPK